MAIYVSYNYLDALTGEIFDQRTSRGGPVAPDGCVFDFAITSNGPTTTPVFYGTTTGDANAKGILRSNIPAEEYEQLRAAELAAREAQAVREEAEVITQKRAAVNAESDRRIALGFAYQDLVFDFDAKSKARITGAATLAGFAAANGAQPGDYRWHGGDSDFSWILRDNSTQPIDAPTMFTIGRAAAAWEEAHVFAGRALKEREDGIPADFMEDQYWPSKA